MKHATTTVILASLIAFFGVRSADNQDDIAAQPAPAREIEEPAKEPVDEPVDELVKEPPVRHNEIIIYTMTPCPACVQWKARYMSDLISKGWSVAEQPLEPRHSVAPSFRVWLKGKPHDKSGWMSPDDLRKIMGGETPQRSLMSCPSGTCSPTSGQLLGLFR